MTKHEVPRYFTFDFDSTIFQVESLDALAATSLPRRPERAALLREIASLTEPVRITASVL